MRDIYLIDFENVASEGLSGITYLTENDQVIIFYSSNSNRLTMKMHILIGKSVCDLQYLEATVGGKNALDHQISTWLGYLIGTGAAERNYYIVSKDMGYKHVASFWNATPMKPHIRCIDSIRSASRADRRRLTQQVLSAEVAAIDAAVDKAQAAAEAEALREAENAENAENAETNETAPAPIAVIAEPFPTEGNEQESISPALVAADPEITREASVESASIIPADDFEAQSEAITVSSDPLDTAEQITATVEVPAETENAAVAFEDTVAVSDSAATEATVPIQDPVLAAQDAEELEALAEAQTQVPRNGRNRNRSRNRRNRSRGAATQEIPAATAPAEATEQPIPDVDLNINTENQPAPVNAQETTTADRIEKKNNRSRSQHQRKNSRNTRSEKAVQPENSEQTADPDTATPRATPTANNKADADTPKPTQSRSRTKPTKSEPTALPERTEKKAPKTQNLGELLQGYSQLSETYLSDLIANGKKQLLCNHLRKHLGQEKGLALYNEIKRTCFR